MEAAFGRYKLADAERLFSSVTFVAFKQVNLSNSLIKMSRNQNGFFFWTVAFATSVILYCCLGFGTIPNTLLSLFSKPFVINISDFNVSFVNAVDITLIGLLLLCFLFVGSTRQTGVAKRRVPKESIELSLLVGICLICGASLIWSGDTLAFYVALEGLSLATFFLIARHVARTGSKELFFKYFCFSSFSAVLVGCGFSLLYVLTQSFSFTTTKNFIFVTELNVLPDIPLQTGHVLAHQLLMVSCWLVLVGFMFKLGSYPFHFLIPDIYEASSTLFLILYNCVLKQFYLFAFMMLVWQVFSGAFSVTCATFLVMSGCGSLIVGTFGAYMQRNFWRFLGYASVAQTGLIVLGLAAGTYKAMIASLVFFWGYLGATLIILLVSSSVYKITQSLSSMGSRPSPDLPAGLGFMSDFGLSLMWSMASSSPGARFGVFAAMAAALFSFAALPPLIGFITKYILLLQFVKAESLVLASLVVWLNLVSTYYYLRVVEVLLSFLQSSHPPGQFFFFKSGPSAYFNVSRHKAPTLSNKDNTQHSFSKKLSLMGGLGFIFISTTWCTNFLFGSAEFLMSTIVMG